MKKPAPVDKRPRCPFCQQIMKNPAALSALQSARSKKRLQAVGPPRKCVCNRDDCPTCTAFWKRRRRLEAKKHS